MRFFDSHAHLNDDAYKDDIEEVIKRCVMSNVEGIVNIGYSLETSKRAIELAESHNFIYATVGLHPQESNTKQNIDYIRDFSKSKKVVAIGEIGLDYHYGEINKELQEKYFTEQIELANDLKLPICIHNRDSDMDMLKILKKYKIENGFVMHCFSSSLEIAKEIIKIGGYISIAGTVTFKNAKNILEVVEYVPADKILIETDCPYLAPEPYRGKRNEPSYVIKVAEKIAEIKKCDLEEIAETTFKNTCGFYKIENRLKLDSSL